MDRTAETPAEIEMFRRLGCDIFGVTRVPEAVLARALEMCYAKVCSVSNMAVGLQEKLTPARVVEASKLITPRLGQALIEAVRALPLTRKACSCSNALKNARFT